MYKLKLYLLKTNGSTGNSKKIRAVKKTKTVEYLSENMGRNIKYRGGGFEYI